MGKTVKLTNNEVLALRGSLAAMIESSLRMSFFTSMRLRKAFREAEQIRKDIGEIYQEILERHQVLDDEGEPEVDDDGNFVFDDQDAADEEYRDLMNTEVEFSVTLPLEAVETINDPDTDGPMFGLADKYSALDLIVTE